MKTTVVIKTVLYNWFMSDKYETSRIYDAPLREKNPFVAGGVTLVEAVI